MMFGAVDLDMLDIDVDTDIDLNGATDGFADGVSGALHGVLLFFNLGDISRMLFLSVVFTFMWLIAVLSKIYIDYSVLSSVFLIRFQKLRYARDWLRSFVDIQEYKTLQGFIDESAFRHTGK